MQSSSQPGVGLPGPMRNDSVLQEVVALVAFVREQQKRLHAQAAVSKEDFAMTMEDIVSHSDSLMSSMLSSPLTGRMNVNPLIGITSQECQESVQQTLGVQSAA